MSVPYGMSRVYGSEAFAGRLLRAGRTEVAPAGSKDRLLAVAAVSLGSASAHAIGVAALHGWRAWRWAMAFTATIGVGAVVLAVTPSWHRSRALDRPPLVVTVSAPVSPPTSRPASTHEAVTAPTDATPAPVARTSVAAANAASARRPHPTATATAAGARAPARVDELGIVRRATLALEAHDPKAALAALDEHDGAARRGVYAEEAAVVRITALVALADRVGAQREGGAFLRTFPESPYAQRVRGMFFGAELADVP